MQTKPKPTYTRNKWRTRVRTRINELLTWNQTWRALGVKELSFIYKDIYRFALYIWLEHILRASLLYDQKTFWFSCVFSRSNIKVPTVNLTNQVPSTPGSNYSTMNILPIHEFTLFPRSALLKLFTYVKL